MQEEALALSRKVNGPEHPDTLTAMDHLAASYSGTTRPDEALKLREEMLKMREEVLARSREVKGLDHPETGAAAAELGLAHIYHAAGPEFDKKAIHTLRDNAVKGSHLLS